MVHHRGGRMTRAKQDGGLGKAGLHLLRELLSGQAGHYNVKNDKSNFRMVARALQCFTAVPRDKDDVAKRREGEAQDRAHGQIVVDY